MPDNKYDVTDLISSALEQKPVDFQTAFNDILLDRVRNVIDIKKNEVSQKMFGGSQEAGSENSTEF